MTLVLTTTCDYALMVAIAEGTGFPSFSDRDIFIHSRLALHLPDTVGDLIPPSTIISAKPTKLTPSPQWRTTLVYFLSEKLLKRLKRRRAEVTLHVTTMTERGDMHELGTVALRVDNAKTIKATQKRYQQPQQQQEQPPFNILKNYVVDKGDWKPVIQDGHAATADCAQIKVGLFVIEMPLHAGERETTASSVRHYQTFNKPLEDSINNDSSFDDLDLEIHSMDSSDGMTTNISSFMATDDSNENDMNHMDTIDQQPIPTTPTEDRTNVNKKEYPSTASQSIMGCFRVIQHKNGSFPYLQIGNGAQRYTFVLRLVKATAVMSLIPPSLINNSKCNGNSNNTMQKLMQYTFSDWQVKHDVMTKGNSWLVTDQPMCLSLQGHLHDLQQWLSQQGPIEVCLVLADKVAKCEHTIGKAMVRLEGWCPLGIEQASFPIHDRSNRLHVDQPFQFARVVVQLGLVEGWEGYLGGQQMDLGLINSGGGGGDSNSGDGLVQQQKYPFLLIK